MLLHQKILNRSSKRFHMVDFKLQLIFTVLAFIKSSIVKLDLDILPSLCTSIEVLGYNVQNIDATRHHYQSFTKISTLTKIGI